MFWVVLIVLIVFSSLDNLIDAYRRKDPKYQEELLLKEKERSKDQEELIQLLHEYEGVECVLSFSNVYLISQYADKLSGKLVSVEDDWIEIEIGKEKKRKRIILKIEDISSVSKIV